MNYSNTKLCSMTKMYFNTKLYSIAQKNKISLQIIPMILFFRANYFFLLMLNKMILNN